MTDFTRLKYCIFDSSKSLLLPIFVIPCLFSFILLLLSFLCVPSLIVIGQLSLWWLWIWTWSLDPLLTNKTKWWYMLWLIPFSLCPPFFLNLFIPLFLFLFFPLFPSSLVAVLAAALLSSSLNHVASFQKKEKKRKKERRCCIQMLLVDSFFRPLSLQLLFEEVDIEKRRRTAIMYQL